MEGKSMQKKRNKKQKHFGLVLLGIVVAFIVFASMFYHSHFTIGTYIQGVDCSCLTVEKAKNNIEETLGKRTSVIWFDSNHTYEVTLDKLGVNVNENLLHEILKNQKLGDMTKINNYSGIVSFDEKAIERYLRDLQEMQGSSGSQNAFIEWNDETQKFQIAQEQYGKVIDFEENYKLFIEKLEQGEYGIKLSKPTIIEPEIVTSMLEPRLEAMNDIIKGVQVPNLNTRIELDITEQRVLMYVDGKCLLDTPCVTGNVAGGCSTPTGVYYLYYKERNAVLRGSNSDGSKYASPVDYWMPFNGGIGFHDASWRNGVFGGEIYKTDGSHGCVNMPHEAAKTLYENISTSIPILVYES